MSFHVRTALVVWAFAGLIAINGCNKPQPKPKAPGKPVQQEEHKHPETYAEAVEELAEMDTQIREAFAIDDVEKAHEKAHEPLHEVGHILEEVPELAAKEDFSDEAKKEIGDATNKLLDAFGAVDEMFHGGEGKKYEEVADTIAANLKVLQSHPAPPTPVEEPAPPAPEAPKPEAPKPEEK